MNQLFYVSRRSSSEHDAGPPANPRRSRTQIYMTTSSYLNFNTSPFLTFAPLYFD